jgi:hypothetical protein
MPFIIFYEYVLMVRSLEKRAHAVVTPHWRIAFEESKIGLYKHRKPSTEAVQHSTPRFSPFLYPLQDHNAHYSSAATTATVCTIVEPFYLSFLGPVWQRELAVVTQEAQHHQRTMR